MLPIANLLLLGGTAYTAYEDAKERSVHDWPMYVVGGLLLANLALNSTLESLILRAGLALVVFIALERISKQFTQDIGKGDGIYLTLVLLTLPFSDLPAFLIAGSILGLALNGFNKQPGIPLVTAWWFSILGLTIVKALNLVA